MKLSIKLVCLFVFLSYHPCTSDIISHWSPWNACMGMMNCYQRIRVCIEPEDLTIPPMLCRHGNDSREEKMYNCQSCNGTWEFLQTLTDCAPSCYNSSKTVIYRCSTNISCLLQTVSPCNTPSLCTGTWVANKTLCNTECDARGVRKLSISCMKNGIASSACPDSYGFQRKILKERCNSTCLSWSSWRNASECSTSCGGGNAMQIRSCTKAPICAGFKSSLYRGNETTFQSCNAHSCPAWSQWSTNGHCLANVRSWTRSCVYKGQPYIGCDGNESFQTKLSLCIEANATTTAATALHGASIIPSPLSFYLIIALAGLCLFIFIICILLCVKLFARKKIRKQLTRNGFVEDSHKKYDSNLDLSDFQTQISNITPPVTPYKVPLKDEKEFSVKVQRSKSLKSLSENMNRGSNRNNYSMTTLPAKKSATLDNGIHRSQSTGSKQQQEDGSPKQIVPLRPRPSVRRAERLREKRERKLSRKLESGELAHNYQDSNGNSYLYRRAHSEGDILSPVHSAIPTNEKDDAGTVPNPKPRKPLRKHSSILLNQNLSNQAYNVHSSMDEIRVETTDMTNNSANPMSPSMKPRKPRRNTSMRTSFINERMKHQKPPLSPERNGLSKSLGDLTEQGSDTSRSGSPFQRRDIQDDSVAVDSL
nr:uncharacterized protein LOC100183196 [Ciona intestinalis]|eukprot:XP_018670086.1 uncharacterized protein LOC100183196 [Ciona intestinalis]